MYHRVHRTESPIGSRLNRLFKVEARIEHGGNSTFRRRLDHIILARKHWYGFNSGFTFERIVILRRSFELSRLGIYTHFFRMRIYVEECQMLSFT